jgi:hypothetical protein
MQHVIVTSRNNLTMFPMRLATIIRGTTPESINKNPGVTL